MKKVIVVIACLGLTFSAQAQMYKSIGADGKVTYSDTPPPANGRVEKRSADGNALSSDGLPYELTQAQKTSPVVLYSTAGCIPCDDGRRLLNARGIPFSEKTVTSNDEIARLKQLNGDNQLPLLTVGRDKLRGFEATGWNMALTAAGYPLTSKLPKGFSNPPADALVPAVKPAAGVPTDARRSTATENASSPNGALPEPIGNAPPGFRF